MAILEKSYELAAKYNLNGEQNGQVAQVTPAGTITQKPQAYPVQAVRENTVSGLQQPMNDVEFIQAYSQTGTTVSIRQSARVTQWEKHDSCLHPPRPNPDRRANGQTAVA